jgi:hypothetical protein
MPHLSAETLARLVDEAPLPPEQAHLDACSECRAELDAMRDDVQALALLPDMAPAPDAWDTLSARLQEEGLMRRRSLTFPVSRYAQLAAAIVLFVAGTAAGRLTAAPGTDAAATSAQAGAGMPVATTSPTNGGGITGFMGAGDDPVQVATAECAVAPRPAPGGAPRQDNARPLPPRQSPVNFASSGGRVQQPGTMDEAAALLRQTEQLYLTALTRYAELTTQSEVNDPVARLAALQSIVMTTQAALSQTPSDPVINGAHLTAVAQRDAALRQVAAVSTPWH